jgi:uncharacterized protein (UPF0179 family)
MFIKAAINITVTNLTNYRSVAALGGASFFIDEFEDLILINDMKTIDCVATESNGIINLKSLITSSKMTIKNLECKSNRAFQGSCVYFESLSAINIDNMKMDNCTGSAIKAQQYQNVPLNI